jgi:hypothetical protein
MHACIKNCARDGLWSISLNKLAVT